MPPRIIALLATACLTIGWVIASVVSPPVARVQGLPENPRSRQQAPSETPPTFTEQLHLRLSQAPLPPVARRNPFVFGTPIREQRAAAAAPSEESADSLPAREPEPPPGPSFALSGIGFRKVDEDTVRTAVIVDGNAVRLAKVGDVVSGYTVAEIGDDTVTLHGSAGERVVLRLKQ